MKIFVNALTMLRFLATFFLPFIFNMANPTVLLIIVILILLTDTFDGYLARKCHVQTLFGSIMDAIADKFFGIIILLIIARYNNYYYLLALLELIISFINFVAALNGVNTKSIMIGKIKMWILSLNVVYGLIYIFKEKLKINLYNKYISIISIMMCILIQGIVIILYLYNLIKNYKAGKLKRNNTKEKKNLKVILFDTEYYLNNKSKSLSEQLL